MADSIMVFDIGGTNLRGACYSPGADEIGKPIIVPTPNRLLHPDLSADQLYRKLLGAIFAVGEELMADHSFAAVSIAFPGPVDCDERVLAAPGIWGLNPDGPIRLVDDIRQEWPLPEIYVANDLTAAGYRHLEKGDETFCLVTISTGIGSKVFIDGQPQLGPTGTGGEIGHAKVSFSPAAPLCDCGHRGHLQAFSSGRGVLGRIRQEARDNPDRFAASYLGQVCNDPEAIANESIVEAFKTADRFAVEFVCQSIAPLAAMLVNLSLALGLDRFVIVGGFALAMGESYRREIARQAAEICWDRSLDWADMIRFGYGDDLSGLIGAGRLAAAKRSQKHESD